MAKKEKSLFEPPFVDLGVTYALYLYLVEKRVVDFIFVIIELLFHYLLWLRRYKRKSVEVGVFRRGWVILVNI